MVGSILALSVKPCRACQLSQGESPWHSGIVSGSSAEFVVSPEPLPLGEVDLRSKDGEGKKRYGTPPHCAAYAVVEGV